MSSTSIVNVFISFLFIIIIIIIIIIIWDFFFNILMFTIFKLPHFYYKKFVHEEKN